MHPHPGPVYLSRNSNAVNSISVNPEFSKLNERQKKTVLSTASNAITKLSGGDTNSLLSALRNECIPSPTPSSSQEAILKSIGHVLSALGVTRDNGESADGEESDDKQSSHHGVSDKTAWILRALLVPLIDAGVSRAEILEAGFPNTSYHRVKNLYDAEGIKACLETQTRGRKTLYNAKPEILEKMRVHLNTPEVSNYSNISPNVDGSLNRSLERPVSRSFTKVDFKKSVVAGGGKSVEGMVSVASLYKYKPATIKAPSFNPYSCSDCKQRKYDIDAITRLISDPSVTLTHTTAVPFSNCMPRNPNLIALFPKQI